MVKQTVEDMEAKKDVQGLIQALNDDNPMVRRAAVLALGNLGDSKAIVPLLDALENVTWKLTAKHGAEVATALGDIGDSRAVEPLIRAIETADFDFFREEAIKALGKICDLRAFEPLIKALNHEKSPTRNYAAGALGMLGDKRAVEPLLDYMKSAEKFDRIKAVWALAGINDKRIPEILQSFINDAEISLAARNALEACKLSTVRQAQKKGLLRWRDFRTT